MAREDMAHLRRFAKQVGVKAVLSYSKGQLEQALRDAGHEPPNAVGNHKLQPAVGLTLSLLRSAWSNCCASLFARLPDCERLAFLHALHNGD